MRRYVQDVSGTCRGHVQRTSRTSNEELLDQTTITPESASRPSAQTPRLPQASPGRGESTRDRQAPERNGVRGRTGRAPEQNVEDVLTACPDRSRAITGLADDQAANAAGKRSIHVAESCRPVPTVSDEPPGGPFSKPGPSWVDAMRGDPQFEALNDYSVAGWARFARGFARLSLPTSLPGGGGLRPPYGDLAGRLSASPALIRAGCPTLTPYFPPPAPDRLRAGTPPQLQLLRRESSASGSSTHPICPQPTPRHRSTPSRGLSPAKTPGSGLRPPPAL